MLKLVPSILLVTVAFRALALEPGKTLTQYAHRIWGQEEGLFQPTIYSILQTRDGFLWLGTQDSLIRFDGMRFREFDHAGTAVLHGSLVRALLQDQAGSIWVGSVGKGLAEIRNDGTLRRYDSGNGFPDNVFCLDSDSQGGIWACTDKGLVRLSPLAQLRRYAVTDGVHATCEAVDGTRWLAGFRVGLGQLKQGRVVPYTQAGLASTAGVSELQCARDGTLWAGGPGGLLHLGTAHPRLFTVRDGLPDDNVSSLKEAPDGSIWIGTDDGISRYRNGEISVYRTRDGLSHSLVLALQFDREGSLWAGTKDGLDQFADSKVTPYSTVEGMPSNEASALAEDREGRLWIGTLDSGLAMFDGRRFHTITQAQGLAANDVLSIAVAQDGELWAGTQQGVSRLRNGRVVANYGTAQGLSGPAVRSLFVDAQGVLWAGTDGGLDRFEAGRFRASREAQVEGGVLALGRGLGGYLLISAEANRLVYLKDGKFGSYPVTGTSHAIDCYLADPAHNTVWMGTLGSGLLRWQDGKLAHVHVKDGLYDNRVYSILKDDHDNFWMSSSKGIFRLARNELDAFADGKRQGVTSIPFSTGQLRFECRGGVQPAAARTRDGRLWFPTTSGLVVVDPNRLRNNTSEPPVRITSVLIDGRRFEGNARLRLQPSERNLEIRYAGLSFINPEKVTFRYILDGYDKDWTDAGPRREAFFTKLPPGQYHFRVMAKSADLVWSRQAAAVDFTVEPLLYQRRWFWPAAILLLAMAIAGTWRLRMRQLRHQFGLVLAERSRIARELHDTLLQGLSGVTMQLQALWTRLPASQERETLGGIIQDAGACAAEARKSLWGLRTDVSAPSFFSEKLAELARSASGEATSRLSLQLQPVSLQDLPETEFQLLRIAGEAIANALEHSQAGSVDVRLALEARTLLLTIADDGVGFASDRDHGRLGRFGLVGMQERAQEIGASLEIASSPGSGTKVSVRLQIG